MEMALVAQKADETVYDGEGGAYHAWSAFKSPLLMETKLGAGRLLLHPLGFALPHFSDSSKLAFVLEGKCTVGLVTPNTSEERVVVIKKGDVLPLPRGMVSWWFNDGDIDSTTIFVGETTKALVSGEMGYFFLVGVQGILHGFQSDLVAKIFNLDNKEAEDIVSSQAGGMIVKLRNGIKFPNPTEDSHIKEKVYATIDTLQDADVVVEGGGIINSLTEKDIPVLGGMELSARFVRLEGKAILAPSYVVDGSIRVIYVGKGSGWIRAVGNEGKPSFDGEVGEGDLIIVPQFYVVAVIADQIGMELFSIITSSKPVFEQLAGNDSVWKEISPVVLQSALNISPQLEELFRLNNTKTMMIIPPRI